MPFSPCSPKPLGGPQYFVSLHHHTNWHFKDQVKIAKLMFHSIYMFKFALGFPDITNIIRGHLMDPRGINVYLWRIDDDPLNTTKILLLVASHYVLLLCTNVQHYSSLPFSQRVPMKYLEGHTHVGFSATSSHWPSFSQGGSQIATMNTGSRVNTNNCQDSDQTGETQTYLGFRWTHNG